MTDRPINCKPWEVCALLDGRKTMTRRLAWRVSINEGGVVYDAGGGQMDYVEPHEVRRPSPWQRVQPGDRLWVREAWQYARKQYCACPQPSEPSPCDDWHEGIGCRSDREGIVLRADGDQAPIWRPSIHMPRWASRLTLIVTATKIEKLLDITEEDARAEGFAGGKIDDGFGARNFGDGWTVKSLGVFASATGMFQLAWKGLHPKWDGFSSPEVVALTFRIVRANIDSAEARAA